MIHFVYSGEFRTFADCFANHVKTFGAPHSLTWNDEPFEEFNIEIPVEKRAGETYPNNVLRMWKRRQVAAMRMIERIDPDDIVVFLRPDVLINNQIILQTLDIHSNKIFIPSENDYRDGINDQMCIGSKANTFIWASIFNHWEDYYNEGVLFHSETMLKHHLKAQGIEVVRLPQTNTILR